MHVNEVESWGSKPTSHGSKLTRCIAAVEKAFREPTDQSGGALKSGPAEAPLAKM